MIALLSLILGVARADEGMWLPEQLPGLSDELAALGLELPPSQLADPAQDPLAAVVSLGFCSAAFVSEDGLIGTNHHCVSGYLSYLSDAANDRARDGYLAGSREEELWAGPAARLYVVESIEDVTDAVLRRVRPRTPDLKRREQVDAAKKALVAACEAQPNRRCRVASYYGGRTYRLITQRELRDVRLVYAPPYAVGSYGGEVDNWEWPRHAGDFAFLRAYVAPDGSTADHAPENVPYKPPHHLTVATEGVAPGDFVMVAGYPGSTYRYRSAAELRFHAETVYPRKVAVYTELVALLTEEAAKDPEAAARLSSPIDFVGNSLKYARGMLDNFEKSGVVARKEAEERALTAWVEAHGGPHAEALAELAAIEEAERATWARDTVAGWLMWMPDLLGATHTAYRFAVEREKPDLKRDAGYQDRDLARARHRLEAMDHTLWLPADRRVMALLLRETQALPADARVPQLDAWLAAQGGVDAALERLYAAPALAGAEARLALLEMDRAAFEASDDPWVELAVALEAWQAPLRQLEREREGARLRLQPLYIEALQASRGGHFYPDANSTLRVTVGRVEGYAPRDGVLHLPQTTVAGVVEKAGPAPFDAPQRLLDAAPGAPQSAYADPALKDVPVDFLSTLDTTGGNSGSATLNGRGELVGFVFDGNYESMSADWMFDPALTRSIHVDIRYVLWLLDAVEGAGWIVEELSPAH
ncbi:MAG: S46 family peptidase [Alphaproteobacteria bacterium]|nr:S46 family peptidase [Alphaproteobacteria bacterium]